MNTAAAVLDAAQRAGLVQITEKAAQTLLRVAQQVNMPSAQGKIMLGLAQAELERGLAALQNGSETGEVSEKTATAETNGVSP